MRDRLMKLLCGVECDGEETFGNCPQRRDGQCRTVQKLEMCQIGAIADHLLANGVIVPPCKVGDIVYRICKQKYPVDAYRMRWEEDWVVLSRLFDLSMISEIGKTVFLTREEAEQALKGENHAEIH